MADSQTFKDKQYAFAAHLRDRTAIEVARLLGEVIGGFRPPPGYEA